MTVDVSFMHEVEHALEKGTVGRRRRTPTARDRSVHPRSRLNTRTKRSLCLTTSSPGSRWTSNCRRGHCSRSALHRFQTRRPTSFVRLRSTMRLRWLVRVLIQSERLDDPTLVENARKKSQEHLLAISRRRSLSEMVTDVLLERGDQQVVLSTAENRGAKFSEAGFEMLVQRSAGDDRLTGCVGSRPDIPPHLFLKLLAIASEYRPRETRSRAPAGQGARSIAPLPRLRVEFGRRRSRDRRTMARHRLWSIRCTSRVNSTTAGWERSRRLAGSRKPRPHSP